jgi:hypothetical protein
MNLASVVSQLRSERERLTKELSRVDGALKAISGLTGTNGTGRARRTVSAAGRKRIAAAQKKRWAKWKKQKAA